MPVAKKKNHIYLDCLCNFFSRVSDETEPQCLFLELKLAQPAHCTRAKNSDTETIKMHAS